MVSASSEVNDQPMSDDETYRGAFNRVKNAKQVNGAVGLLTNDLIMRAEYYETAVLLALIPFVNPDLYKSR